LELLRGTLRIEDEEHGSALATLLPTLSIWRREQQEHAAVDSWRYRIVWKPLESNPAGAADLSGHWLIVGPATLADDGMASTLAGAISERGGTVIAMQVCGEDADRGRLAPRLRNALQELKCQTDDRVALRGVLSLVALDEAPLPAQSALPTGLALNVALVQAL